MTTFYIIHLTLGATLCKLHLLHHCGEKIDAKESTEWFLQKKRRETPSGERQAERKSQRNISRRCQTHQLVTWAVSGMRCDSTRHLRHSSSAHTSNRAGEVADRVLCTPPTLVPNCPCLWSGRYGDPRCLEPRRTEVYIGFWKLDNGCNARSIGNLFQEISVDVERGTPSVCLYGHCHYIYICSDWTQTPKDYDSVAIHADIHVEIKMVSWLCI